MQEIRRVMNRSSRRNFFKRTSLLGLLGSVPGGRRLAMAMAAKDTQDSMKGIRASGCGPSSMPRVHIRTSAVHSYRRSARCRGRRRQAHVPIKDLTKATGERSAQLTGNAGALVTTGAAGAIFGGTCACIAGDDPDKMKRLPFTDGMKQ